VVLLEQTAGLVLLFRRQVFEGFHPVQDSRLLVGRQAIEVSQPVQQVLLFIGSQATTEHRIVLQLLLLLRLRQVAELPQPVPLMRSRTIQMRTGRSPPARDELLARSDYPLPRQESAAIVLVAAAQHYVCARTEVHTPVLCQRPQPMRSRRDKGRA